MENRVPMRARYLREETLRLYSLIQARRGVKQMTCHDVKTHKIHVSGQIIATKKHDKNH